VAQGEVTHIRSTGLAIVANAGASLTADGGVTEIGGAVDTIVAKKLRAHARAVATAFGSAGVAIVAIRGRVARANATTDVVHRHLGRVRRETTMIGTAGHHRTTTGDAEVDDVSVGRELRGAMDVERQGNVVRGHGARVDGAGRIGTTGVHERRAGTGECPRRLVKKGGTPRSMTHSFESRERHREFPAATGRRLHTHTAHGRQPLTAGDAAGWSTRRQAAAPIALGIVHRDVVAWMRGVDVHAVRAAHLQVGIGILFRGGRVADRRLAAYREVGALGRGQRVTVRRDAKDGAARREHDHT